VSSATALDPVSVPGPFAFSFRQLRPPVTAITPVSAEVPLGVRGPGSWTQPGLGAVPPLVGVSGTGVYRTLSAAPAVGALTLPPDWFAPGVRVLLDLGRVRDVSGLRIGGIGVGTHPWPGHVYDVTAAVRPGANALEIAVTNGSANSAVGFQASPLRDAGLLTAPVARAVVDVSATAPLSCAPSCTGVLNRAGRRSRP
jgi:hypothetical protein